MGFVPLHHRLRQDEVQRSTGIGNTYLVKCFCFAAFSFCVTGVMRLSVGETNLGLLERTRE